MTTYSDWIIIPKDRKSDLPPDAKVQLMWRNEDVEYAEENNDIEDVWDCVCPDGLWFKHIFAYRVVQEPVEEVREYECGGNFELPTTLFFADYNKSTDGVIKGTAIQTTRDGRPYRFEWRASE